MIFNDQQTTKRIDSYIRIRCLFCYYFQIKIQSESKRKMENIRKNIKDDDDDGYRQ